MKLVSKEELIAGKYYMEYYNAPFASKSIYKGKYNGVAMKGISRVASEIEFGGAIYMRIDIYDYNARWTTNEILGILYELSEEEVLQCVVMEQL